METYYRVTVYVTGIKKRARKVQKHGLEFPKVPTGNVIDFDDLKRKAVALANSSMRSWEGVVKVVMNYCEYEDGGEGAFSRETWEPFSDKNIHFQFFKHEVE